MSQQHHKTPLFSIVIPTYNRSELVQGAVRSTLSQTFGDFEVVVSDNCSEDDTRTVIERFEDPRVRYARTPSHGTIGDSWEFARSQARGTLVMMLSDDDALVPATLARFAEAHHRHNADFLFCNLAEYRDQSFVGSEGNIVRCGPFSGTMHVVSADEFVRPLFAFRPGFNMHPSAFMFSAELADRIAQRNGRFFRSNGVEYFAWPLAAVLSRNIVHIDQPLVILGRTAKSWGSTIVLLNPGKEQIQKMIDDVAHDRDWIPLTNFTLCNLIAEGLLLGKKMFPDLLAPYPFDESRYLRATLTELRRRKALEVDVEREIQELLDYAGKYPDLKTDLARLAAEPAERVSAARRLGRALRLNLVFRRLKALNQIRKIKRGEVQAGFMAAGSDFGFRDAVGCANFISKVTSLTNTESEHVRLNEAATPVTAEH
jgi:glycosyltransferase involved in cell wall biosynthesis